MVTPSHPTFGTLLKRYRLAAGLTQEELAERANLSARAISDLERGLKTKPRRDTVELLAEALELSEADRAALGATVSRRLGPSAPYPLSEPSLADARSPALVGRGKQPTLLAGGRRHNLPSPATPLIGREQEVASAHQLLLSADVRLLTLTGTGGCGKTRLALEVASELLDRFPDGVWLVELGGLSEPALVPQAVAMVLGVREGPRRSLLDSLAASLRSRQLLLLLDNCEHLVDACAQLAEGLLESAPHVRLLATSREPLRIAAETIYRVLPLSVPHPQRVPSLDELVRYSGVQLFIERARAVQPDFSASEQNAGPIANVCARLDGIPLAIELAAARTKVLAVEQISERLDDCFPLLTRGMRTAPTRQRTLKATLDWSFRLLSVSEQVLFCRLSVFAGAFDLEAAEVVGSDEWSAPSGEKSGDTKLSSAPCLAPPDILDLLTGLVDKSLVLSYDRSGKARYRLLETIRQYGLERLRASGEENVIRCRHADYYQKLAEMAEGELFEAEQVVWHDRLETHLDDLRAALSWSRAESERSDVGLRLAGALWRFWDVRGHMGEGRRWLAELLERVPESTRSRGRAKGLFAAGWLAMLQEGGTAANPLVEQSLALWRMLDDQRGLGWSLWLGGLVKGRHDSGAGLVLAEEGLALARAGGDRTLAGWCLWLIGELMRVQGDLERAAAFFEQGLAVAAERGDAAGIAFSLRSLAQVASYQGDYVQATVHLKECLAVRLSLNDRWNIPDSLEGLAQVASAQGQVERAVRLYGAAEALREASGTTLLGARQGRREQHLDAAREALGETAFAAVWDEGRTMPAEQAIAYAVEDVRLGSSPDPLQKDRAPSTLRVSQPSLLSRRELEVARLLARGLTNRQIAEELTITEGTAGVHVVHILNKLGFNSRWQVADWAIEHGLLERPPD